jgi:hypothetical protein
MIQTAVKYCVMDQIIFLILKVIVALAAEIDFIKEIF